MSISFLQFSINSFLHLAISIYGYREDNIGVYQIFLTEGGRSPTDVEKIRRFAQSYRGEHGIVSWQQYLGTSLSIEGSLNEYYLL